MVAILHFWLKQFSAFFYLQDSLILPTKFWDDWPFHSGEVQNRFSRWWRWISHQKSFWSTSRPDTSYQVSSQLTFWLNRSSKEIFKIVLWRPSWISCLNSVTCSYFLSTTYFDTSNEVSSQLAFRLRRSITNKKFKTDFQATMGHLGFLIKTILTIFDLKVAPTLATKFQVSWSFSSWQEVQNRFSRWRPWRQSRISG